MAKWGEGDARWIVQDREDGANVNGWHWEEKNRMHWVKEQIPAMLDQLTVECPSSRVQVRIKEVSKVDGHAYVAIRKGGKRLGVYDLNLEVKWEGIPEAGVASKDNDEEGEEKAEEKTVEGTLSIAEFAPESDEDDWMIDCNTTATGKHAVTCKKVALSELKASILERLEPLHKKLLATLD